MLQNSADSVVYLFANSVGNFKSPCVFSNLFLWSQVSLIHFNLPRLTSILISRFILELMELSAARRNSWVSIGNVISSDITMHASDVISDLCEDEIDQD